MAKNKKRRFLGVGIGIGLIAAIGLLAFAFVGLQALAVSESDSGDEVGIGGIEREMEGDVGEMTVAASAVTSSINYQGRLTDSAGEPLSGTYEMTLRLYSTSSGGTALSTDTHTVKVTDGLFNTNISFDQNYFDGKELWLGITVETDSEMTPRQELRPVPYALSLRPGAVIKGSVSSGPVLKVENTYDYTWGGGIWALVHGDNSYGVCAGTSGIDSDGVRAYTTGNYSEGVRAYTHGYDSDGVSAYTTGNSSEGVRAHTHGYGSYGVCAYTHGDNSKGVHALTHGYNSDGVYADTYGNSSEGVYALTHGYGSYGVCAYTYGDNSKGVHALTHGNYSEGVHAHTHGHHSDGVSARTYGHHSDGVSAYTYGDGSDGVSANTSGANSDGVYARTYGPHSDGVYADTYGDFSDGVRAHTSGFGSYGVYARTYGNNSEGVYALTYGYGSYGVYADTYGDHSEGVYTRTDGDDSEGVYALTYGDHSEGVYAYSKKSSGITANTGRADHNYAFYTWDDNIYVGGKINVVGTVDPIITECFNADPEVDYEIGDVVCLAEDSSNVKPCTKVDDTKVVGVVGPTVELEDGEISVVIMGYRGARPDEEHVEVQEKRLEKAEARAAEVKLSKLSGSEKAKEKENLESEIAMLRSEIEEAKSITRQVVKVKADASYAPIKRGDLLTTSSTEGHAMKAQPVDIGGVEIHRPGTIIGKAMEPLESGTGLVEVFVTLQ